MGRTRERIDNGPYGSNKHQWTWDETTASWHRVHSPPITHPTSSHERSIVTIPKLNIRVILGGNRPVLQKNQII